MSQYNSQRVDDIDFHKIKLSDPIKRGNGWSQSFTYNKENLKIETPELVCTFPVNSYKYNDKSTEKFSLTVTLDDHKDGVGNFKDFIAVIDETVQTTYKDDYKEDEPNWTYYSSIKIDKDGKYKPNLRCKMVSNRNRFKCNIFKDGEVISDKIEDVRKVVKRGTVVKLILQLNPIWKINKKYGVSWQILGLNIIDKNVRFSRPPAFKNRKGELKLPKTNVFIDKVKEIKITPTENKTSNDYTSCDCMFSPCTHNPAPNGYIK